MVGEPERDSNKEVATIAAARIRNSVGIWCFAWITLRLHPHENLPFLRVSFNHLILAAASTNDCELLLGDAGFDAPVGDKPDDGDGDVAKSGDPWAEESERDGGSINDDGNFAFSVAADGGRQCGFRTMNGEKCSDENEVGDAGEKEYDSVERDGPRGKVVVTHPSGGEGNQR